MSKHNPFLGFTYLLRMIVLWIIPTSLSASIPSNHPDELTPIDNLQEAIIKKHHSKQAKLINRAFSALQNKKYSEALNLSSKSLSDFQFSDYGLWIAAGALRGSAQQLNQKRNYSASLNASQKSITMILQIESKNPYSPFIRDLPKEMGLSELVSGESYCGMKKWILCQQTFEKAFQRLQTQNTLTLISSQSIEEYAKSCQKKEGPLCLGWLQKLSTVFSKKSLESQTIAKLFPNLSNLTDKQKAIKSASKVTMSYKAPDLDQAAFEAAMKLYFEESYSKAAKSFKQFLEDYPRSAHRFRARYWLAQSYVNSNDQEIAQKIHQELHQDSPLTFYGFLASMATGQPLDTTIRATLPLAIDTDPSLQPHESFHLRRAENFVAEKADELASYELRYLRSRDSLSSPFLLYLAMLNYEAKNYNHGFFLVGELIQRGYEGIISSFGLRLIFPVNFMNLIKANADENGLDPILVLSLIKQESAFDEDANSSSGAMGLMQLMPATANETDPQIKTAELVEASKNVAIGTKYLKKLLLRFNGNIVYALAGYNAGPNAVDRWIKESGGKKRMLEFIEAIPYKETREYVGAIIRNYFWYSKRLNGGTQKTLDYFWNVYGPPETPAAR